MTGNKAEDMTNLSVTLRIVHESGYCRGECVGSTLQHVGVASIRRDGVFLVFFRIDGSISGKTLKVVDSHGTSSGLGAILIVSNSNQDVRVRSRREVSALLLVVEVCVKGFLQSDRK